ncbi:MAG: PKD domain-containing protein [Thermoprotei archaeon]
MTKTLKLGLTVFPDLKLSVKATLTEADAGQPVAFYANVSGGAPPVNVAWYVNGTLASLGQSLTYAFPSPGTYVVTTVATDSLGVKSSHQVKVLVVPPLALKPTLSVQGKSLANAPKALVIDEGVPVTISVATNGGVPPITVAWYLNGSLVGHGDSLEVPHLKPGTHEVAVKAQDRAGYSVSDVFTLVVVPPPKVYVRVLNASGSAFVYNTTATLIPGVSGGVNATVFVYQNGQLVGRFSPGQPVTLNLAMGDNVVKIVAIDQYGLNSTYVLTITSGYTPTFYGVVGGAAVAVLIIALALLKRRK